MDQNFKTPNIAEMRTEELQEDFEKLVALKAMYQKELMDVKLKIKEAGILKTKGRPISTQAYRHLCERKVELGTSIDKAQIDMGKITREIKTRDHEENLRKSNHVSGMTEKLFMQIAKEMLPEAKYNEIYMNVKLKMLDI